MSTIGDVIARHREEILHRWEEDAGHGGPGQGMKRPELVSVMPAYLDLLGRGAGGEQVDLSALHELGAQHELLERHTTHRLRYGFELQEIVTEFAILSRCVSRALDEEPAQERPPPEDIARLFRELYEAVMAVTRIFNEHMLEDQQREKRYDRLLQRIASAAMSGPDHATLPVRKLLGEALNVVMAAMNAQSAALLLYDATSNRLLVSVSTGTAAEALEAYVSKLDESTFAGRVVSSDLGTTFVSDAETSELTGDEALRRSGIHSLLGVRLAAGHLLRAVVYIGRCERSFRVSEASRLEELAVSLALHLEIARLHAALSEEKQCMAQEGELRERFVSVLMHDLMGPLEAAKADACRLLEPWNIENPPEVAAKVIRDLKHIEWMVRGLLDVHKIRAGQPLHLPVGECDLGAIARDAIEELRASHGSRFVVHAVRGIRGIWSAEQLHRAIWNLAVNGIEHGATGRPVTVSVVANRGAAEVSVHNEGREIPPLEQAELFQPFSLPGSATRGPRRGWGLGLTFVWGCVEAHGGSVVVESRPGHGTTFRLQLPYDARPYTE